MPELISDYSKVTGYKVTIQKSIDFLHTINEQEESEMKNITIYISTPKMKF